MGSSPSNHGRWIGGTQVKCIRDIISNSVARTAADAQQYPPGEAAEDTGEVQVATVDSFQVCSIPDRGMLHIPLLHSRAPKCRWSALKSGVHSSAGGIPLGRNIPRLIVSCVCLRHYASSKDCCSQGMEKDVIILSTVITRNNASFASDAQRLNVALTRARHHLLLAGHAGAVQQCSPALAAIITVCRKTPGGFHPSGRLLLHTQSCVCSKTASAI